MAVKKKKDLDFIRPELEEMLHKKAQTLDENRGEAIAALHARGQRSARENLADLFDEGTFREYGAFAVSASRSTQDVDALFKSSPADGLISGVGQVNGSLFEAEHSRCCVAAYDPSVFAGTQGYWNHRKLDRIVTLARQIKAPLIIFAQGGGGRPSDSDMPILNVAGVNFVSWAELSRLNGLVPTIGVVSRYSFAGNAALAGCCDCIIATKNSSMGMGGPVMIEGGGLGKYHPTEVGPAEVQSKNGVIDLLAEDEAEAVQLAKRYLSYFQGPLREWEVKDQRLLRHIIPERRRRAYEVREIIDVLADKDSVLELRPGFATNLVTSLIRFEGRTCGVMANRVAYLSGAVDAAAADKASRFMQLCNAHRFPLISLIDCPGFMVGPQAESEALVRRAANMYVNGARLKVPFLSLFLRKSYGLGAIAMAYGSTLDNVLTAAWPTAEFAGMGIEGQVKLGHKHELEAIEDPEQRQARFDELVAMLYENGKALRAASYLEVDALIDPIESRDWIRSMLTGCPPQDDDRRYIDTW